jgi:hypothetical protein
MHAVGAEGGTSPRATRPTAKASEPPKRAASRQGPLRSTQAEPGSTSRYHAHPRVLSSAVERLLYTERVGGSIPSAPTRSAEAGSRAHGCCGVRRRGEVRSVRRGRLRAHRPRHSQRQRIARRTKRFACSPHAASCIVPRLRGAVVQSVRMLACHAGGRGFESRPLRQSYLQGPCPWQGPCSFGPAAGKRICRERRFAR